MARVTVEEWCAEYGLYRTQYEYIYIHFQLNLLQVCGTGHVIPTAIAVPGRKISVTTAIDLMELLSDCVALAIWTESLDLLWATTLKAYTRPLIYQLP